jgi:hypothetical protein
MKIVPILILLGLPKKKDLGKLFHFCGTSIKKLKRLLD